MFALPESEFVLLPGFTNPTPVDTNLKITFAFYIRTGKPLPDVDSFNSAKPNQRKYLSREAYKNEYSVSLSDLQQLQKFAKANNLQYEQTNHISGQVLLTGTIGAWNKAFSITFTSYDYSYQNTPDKTMGWKGFIMLPNELKGIVLAISSYDLTTRAKKMVSHPAPIEPSCTGQSYWAPEIGKLYNFPAGEKGKGQTIGILEFPGDYLESDLELYYDKIGLKNPPNIKKVELNHFQPPQKVAQTPAFGETNLDIQVATSLATEASYVVYLNAGLGGAYAYDGIFNALFDEENKIDVLSISYGECELMYTAMATGLFNKAMQVASLLGVTVCVSSGDGASPTRWGNVLGGHIVSVNLPASCSYALACGGSYTGSENGRITEETVWNYMNIARNGSTGGLSVFMEKPPYQAQTDLPDNANCSEKIKGRGVPDVASNAAPESGFTIITNGKELRIGGTSAAAPLWAALIAIMNSALGYNLGFINNLLYEDLKGEGLVSIENGNNGAYLAEEGWDACTGWGRPDASALLNALKQLMD